MLFRKNSKIPVANFFLDPHVVRVRIIRLKSHTQSKIKLVMINVLSHNDFTCWFMVSSESHAEITLTDRVGNQPRRSQ